LLRFFFLFRKKLALPALSKGDNNSDKRMNTRRFITARGISKPVACSVNNVNDGNVVKRRSMRNYFEVFSLSCAYRILQRTMYSFQIKGHMFGTWSRVYTNPCLWAA